jgi:membrane protein DedA with SNARE-associated domain
MLEVIIAQFGLPALFIGTFIEGEVVVVVAGLLSRLGYLSLTQVIFTAIVATFIGDAFFFYIGRRRGQKFLEKRPHLAKRAETVHALLHNHRNKILFGFRFLYGLRIATLIALGTTDRESLPTKKFLIINAFNCVIWSLGFVFAGYFFGDFFETFIHSLKKYENNLLIGFAIIGLIIWIVSIVKNREEYE